MDFKTQICHGYTAGQSREPCDSCHVDIEGPMAKKKLDWTA
jgi:hypothetical protein